MEISLKLGSFTGKVDTLGGELVGFSDAIGTQYIWQGDPGSWTGRNPVLFPIVGNLKENRVMIGEKVFEMSRHGFARRGEFSVARQWPEGVCLALEADEKTLAQYPFRFRLEVTHQLLEGGFSTTFRVENRDRKPMPFCIGAHTGFRCPIRAGETFQDYRLVFDEPETATAILPENGLLQREKPGIRLENQNTIPLDHQYFDDMDTLIFEGLKSKGVSLLHKDTGHGLRMEFPDFPMVAFWTMPGAHAPYICLEPWMGCAAFVDESGNFEDKPHCALLGSGQVKELTYTVKLV